MIKVIIFLKIGFDVRGNTLLILVLSNFIFAYNFTWKIE